MGWGHLRNTLVFALLLVIVTQVAAIGERSRPHHDHAGHDHPEIVAAGSDAQARHAAVHALVDQRVSDEQLALLGLRRDERCGPAMYAPAHSHAHEPVTCTHGPDTMAMDAEAAAAGGDIAGYWDFPIRTPKGIPCYQKGKRVKVIYAYEKGTVNRAKLRKHMIREAVAITDEMAVKSSKRANAKARHVKWIMNSKCKLKIHVYAVPSRYTGSIGGYIYWLRSTGRITRSQKALTFHEWSGMFGGCSGLGEVYPDERASKRYNMNNTQPDGGMITWVDAQCIPDIQYTHWMGSLVAAHELWHTLGAVQEGAPNSTPAGHCEDEWDVMCYDDWSGGTMRDVCAGSDGFKADRLLDCRHNDYFDPTPKSGSYLERHWNTASSSWLTTSAPIKWDRLTRPRVRMMSTLAGTDKHINRPVKLVAKANKNPTQMSFFINGQQVGTDTTRTKLANGWFKFAIKVDEWTADSLELTNGKTVRVKAEATDKYGRPGRKKVSATVTVPTVTMTAPTGTTLSFKTNWAAKATAPTGRSLKVLQLLMDGKVVASDSTFPYGGSVTFPSELWGSSVTLAVRAIDSEGSRAETDAKLFSIQAPTFESAVPYYAQVGKPMRSWLGGTGATLVTKVELWRRVYNYSTGSTSYSRVATDTTPSDGFIPTWPSVAASTENESSQFFHRAFDAAGTKLYDGEDRWDTHSPQIYGAAVSGDPTIQVSSPADRVTVARGSVSVSGSVNLGNFGAFPVCSEWPSTNCLDGTPYVYVNGYSMTASRSGSTVTFSGTYDTSWDPAGTFISGYVVVYYYDSSGNWQDATAVTGGPLVFVP